MKKLQIDEDLIWQCQYCGVENTVWVDLTIEGEQDFVEDCRICCRPNHIIVRKDADNNPYLDVRPSDE